MTWPNLPGRCLVARRGSTTVLVDRRLGAMTSTGPVGTMLLDLRDRFDGLDDAVAALHAHFGVDRDRLTADLAGFAARLEALGDDASPSDCARPSPAVPVPAHPPPGDGSATVRFDALGQPVELVCHDAALVAVFEPLLDALPRTEAQRHRFEVWRDGDRVSASENGSLIVDREDLSMAVNAVVTGITGMVMDARSPGRFLLHAAAVAWDGEAIVLGGASNQGKSSTTVELMGSGAAYLTDEVVEVDVAAGRVRGLARPIGLEGAVRRLHPRLRPSWWGDDSSSARWPVAPAALGEVAGECDVGAFVTLELAPGEPTMTTRLAPIAALERALAMTYNLDVLTADDIEALWQLVERIPAVLVRHSGSRAAAGAVAEWRDARARAR